MKLRAKLSARIRQIRKERGLTQAEVASRSGLPVNNITLIEKTPQNLTIDKIEIIANALKVTMAELFGEEKKPELNPSDEFDYHLKRLKDLKKKVIKE